MSYLDHWLAVDEWTFEEAALIFNDKDPDTYRGQVKFSVDISRYINDEWKQRVYQTHKIFKKADWGRYTDEEPVSVIRWSEKANGHAGQFHMYIDVVAYRISLSLLRLGLVAYQLTALAVRWGGGSMSIKCLKRTQRSWAA